MKYLVTGATGLVGNNVVRSLLARGDQVRVLARNTSDSRPLQGLNVEIVRGDLQDPASLSAATDGAQAVIHLAALVHIGWSHSGRVRAVNVEGSRRVALAARDAGARMIHVSSVDALGIGSNGHPADEETPPGGKVPCCYVLSKQESEQVVLELVADGLDAVIVNPGFIFGPWDWKPSSGRMLLEVARRFTPVAPVGGCTLCDVRDVADGILAAVERGQSGRRYILGGHPMTYFDLWSLIADVTGGRAPAIKAGPLMRWIGGAAGDLRRRVTGLEPDLNSAAVRMSSLFHYYSSARAEAELGYHRRPAREAVESAWQWFLAHGYVN